MAGRRPLTLRAAVIASLAVLVAATLLSAGVSVWERHAVSRVQADLRERLRPAQTAVVDLTRAYVDQETGQRGYALTGQRSFLQPYADGRRDADRLQALLGGLLHEDVVAGPLLVAASEAGRRWQQEAAEPEIAARQRGAVDGTDTVVLATRGKVLFDALRQRLAEVAQRIDQLTQDQLGGLATAQGRANAATALAALVAVGMAGWTAWALPRATTRPLARLVRELSAVADGDTSRRITVAGPPEVRTIAAAAETMRTTLVASASALAAAQHQVGAAGERERVAREVGDRTLHRLYALTLGLSRLRAGRPGLAGAVRPLVDEADGIAQELRGIIHPLPAEVAPPVDGP
ncbi:sensor domain CHASE3-containing protein [Friedmanniella luteola]|uniref:Sensor domain CHASE3-containing protein n=1 Tax=Friedmanniella luteola TaxID=546871 RepID=A0A1H1W9T6_9ACTN|nr:CHASE3 domain-containing protein [Friedmanniella luteola]SDS93732.1 sensor domain CHASE3-containing protein [Friedmanniella luteola]